MNEDKRYPTRTLNYNSITINHFFQKCPYNVDADQSLFAEFGFVIGFSFCCCCRFFFVVFFCFGV